MGSFFSSLWRSQPPQPPELDFQWKRVDETLCQDEKLPTTDLVLLTANDHEFDACYSFMQNGKHYYHQTLGHIHFGTFKGSSDVPVALKQCYQGPRCAQTATTQCVQYLNPKAVIFVGICASLRPEKAKLGDVILSYRLITYDDQKVTNDGNVENRGTKTQPGDPMLKLFLGVDDGWKSPLKSPQNSDLKIHHDKSILSGSMLVNNRDVRNELSKRYLNAYGLEMEGAGLLEAVRPFRTQWAVIKAVSDFADGSKDSTGQWQKFSSVMAASVVHNMFKQGVMESWPRSIDMKDGKDPTRERHEETPHVSNEGNEDPQQPSNPSSGTVAQTPQAEFEETDHSPTVLIKEGNILRGSPEPAVLHEIAKKIPSEWRQLGRKLLSSNDVKVIDEDERGVVEKATAMFEKWKQVKGSDATYRLLYEALLLVQRKDIAEEFCLVKT